MTIQTPTTGLERLFRADVTVGPVDDYGDTRARDIVESSPSSVAA